jgi:hypothetical protein
LPVPHERSRLAFVRIPAGSRPFLLRILQ